jgi:putative Holliday junction resolvase
MPILGFDFGSKRIGVAIVPDDTDFALPLITIDGDVDTQWMKLDELIKKQSPRELVVGLPYTMGGAEGEQAAAAREFAGKLFEKYGIPVQLVDERMSSMEATRAGAGDIDASSAAIILDTFLSKKSGAGDDLFDV